MDALSRGPGKGRYEWMRSVGQNQTVIPELPSVTQSYKPIFPVHVQSIAFHKIDTLFVKPALGLHAEIGFRDVAGQKTGQI
jgi:hypothetical protein